MKLLHTEVLLDSVSEGSALHPLIEEVRQDIHAAVSAVKWPQDNEHFVLNPVKKGNGVKPIKVAFQEVLEERDWKLEHRMSLGAGISPGPIDAVRQFDSGLAAIEWETGNISSSHRSLNRMALGLLTGKLIAGVLVLPSREMYNFLTDRIGNYREIRPYFPIWKALHASLPGYLAVIEVEHDSTSGDVPLIQKATDGRALK